jgi:hypothetical protein
MVVLKQTGLIVFAIAIMPFTALRIGPIGLGEIIFLGAFVVLLCQTKLCLPWGKGYVFTRFWLAYIAVTTVGMYYNHLFLGSASGTISQMLFDLAAYLIVTVIVYLLETKALNDPEGFERLAWNAYVAQFLAFAGLHVLSYGVSSIAGLPLRYYQFFSPLVDNLHQAAMVLCSLPFLGMFFFRTRPSLMMKLLLLISAVWYGVMAFETGSTKAFLGLLVGCLVAGVHVIFYSFGYRSQRALITIALIGVVVTIFALNFDEVIGRASVFFVEADPSDARAYLYSKGLKHAMDSPLIGFGPGPHILYIGGKYWDVHNTFLAALLQGGLVALMIFIVFLGFVVRRTFQNPFLLSGLASVMIYTTGGDILRRAPIWIFLLTIFYLATSLRQTDTQAKTVSDQITQQG